MNTGPIQLVVILCEQALEKLIEPELLAAGAKGYSISDARGRGNRGLRDARWLLSSNVRIEILCNAEVAHRIMEMVDSKYCDNYGLVMYTQEVQASRAEKF
jgi:hypothetical protein